MKKALSVLLALVMVFSMSVNVYATNDYTDGTAVIYNGTSSEAYTVTVPASMAPGDTATVTTTGTWASNRKIVITADATVTLVNSINAADKTVLDVEFDGITKAGSNTESVSATADLRVEAISEALFGTWSGTINYSVEMQDK